MKYDMWPTGSTGKLGWFVKPSSRWTYVDIVSTTSPTIRSAKAKLTTRQLNAFRSSSCGPLYTAQQIKKFVGTVKKNRTIEMIAVKNDSDIGGGTAEQSFSKSDMASMLQYLSGRLLTNCPHLIYVFKWHGADASFNSKPNFSTALAQYRISLAKSVVTLKATSFASYILRVQPNNRKFQ